MSNAALYRWDGVKLVTIDHGDARDYTIEAADSFLVSEGRVFALELHRTRFLEAVHERGHSLTGFPGLDPEGFWHAALALIPADANWFPRVELRSARGKASLLLRVRVAPNLSRSAILTTLSQPDPRRVPEIKGPDLEVLVSARTAARQLGADDAVIVTPETYVIDGTTSALVWWRGDILCAPPTVEDAPEFARVSSVTARSLFGMAAALGVETHRERVTPAELEGTEVWALSALHGIRIVTNWLDGPDLAELPGRLHLWQERRAALVQPIGATAP